MASRIRCGGRNAASRESPASARVRRRLPRVRRVGGPKRREAPLDAIELRVGNRGVAGEVAGKTGGGQGSLAGARFVRLARRRAVHLERLACVALPPLDAPDPLDQLRGGGVKGHRSHPCPLAYGLRFQRFGESKHLGACREIGLPSFGERARPRQVVHGGGEAPVGRRDRTGTSASARGHADDDQAWQR
jgi:hypothetical protein